MMLGIPERSSPENSNFKLHDQSMICGFTQLIFRPNCCHSPVCTMLVSSTVTTACDATMRCVLADPRHSSVLIFRLSPSPLPPSAAIRLLCYYCCCPSCRSPGMWSKGSSLTEYSRSPSGTPPLTQTTTTRGIIGSKQIIAARTVLRGEE